MNICTLKIGMFTTEKSRIKKHKTSVQSACVYAVFLAVFLSITSLTAFAQIRDLGALNKAPGVESAPSLIVPVSCRVGRNCFVLSFPDHDPDHGWSDFKCGPLSSNGNAGVEIGPPTEAQMRAGIAVLAAADGIVRSVRDSMPDTGSRNQPLEQIEGREAGNGVYIDHGKGWGSLYGHLMKGSLTVKAGQRVSQGQVLGLIGLSGDTNYPHLYFGMLFNDLPVDPYAIQPVTCTGPSEDAPEKTQDDTTHSTTLWTPAAADSLAYRRTQLVGYGFLDKPVNTEDLLISQNPVYETLTTSETLGLYADFIGLRKGDGFQLRLLSPFGDLLAEREWQFDSPKRRYTGLIGRPLPGARWEAGTWFGEIIVWRIEDSVRRQIFFRRLELTMKNPQDDEL